MLTHEQISEFHENGVFEWGPVLDDAQVEVLREELYRVIESKDRDDVPQPVLLRQFGR